MAKVSMAWSKMLQARSEAELERIAQAWVVGDAPDDGWQENVEQLIEKMQEIISARFAWESLSADAREILHQVIAFAIMDGVPREDAQKLADQDDATFAAALTELE
ncbi:MAG: hypothetical protein ACRDHW_18150, partial [Ktedonobacteraceae bacterium]